MRKYIILFILFTLSISLMFAQSIPADENFYHPNIKSFNKIILQPTGKNDVKIIQDAIDLVAKKGGGTVIIGASLTNYVYNVGEIILKSNVHIKVQPNVVFKTTDNTRVTVFSAGKDGDAINNFSVTCTDTNKFFSFDFTSHLTPEPGAVAISASGASNFKLADFKVIDNFTKFSSIVFNVVESAAGKFLYPKNAIVEHIIVENAHYGYGLIQCQLGENFLVRNVKGSGGATLRLETGSGETAKAFLKDPTIRIDKVYAKDIYCSDGQAAVTLSPHTIANGTVVIEDVTANGCETGVIIASGFLSKNPKKNQAKKDGTAIDNYEYGYFNSNSSIKNLRVIYGKNAQLRTSRFGFVPCDQRNLISEKVSVDEESYRGPTVAGIIYFAKGGTEKEKGFYTVKLDGIKLEGFPKVNGQMQNKEIVVSNAEQIKNCK